MNLYLVKGSEVTPYVLTPAELEKYSKKMIFRVGRQFLTKALGNEEGVRPLDIGGVHVLLSYNHARKTAVKGNSVKEPLGRLVLADSYEYDENTKKVHFMPTHKPVGYLGYFEETDPVHNYFFSNSPMNEVVAGDPEHPNYNNRKETNFSTYELEKISQDRFELMAKAALMVSNLADKKQTNDETIAGIVKEIRRSADEYRMVHRLHRDDLDPITQRAEVMRLANEYPIYMEKIVGSSNVDYEAYIEEMKQLGFLRLVGDEWRYQETAEKESVLLKVPHQGNADKTILEFFKRTDRVDGQFRKLKGILDKLKDVK